MDESRKVQLQVSFVSGLGGAIIAAAVTYWSAVDKSKNEAILNKALADSKEQYLEQIKDSIGNIARAEANAETAAINAQKLISNLTAQEERANLILSKLSTIEKDSSNQVVELNDNNMEKLQKGLASEYEKFQMPSGAVISFNLARCPKGWKEFEPAYGRFVRGIDKTGRIDPDGVRLSGNIQNDMFSQHDHGGNYSFFQPAGAGGADHKNLMIQGGVGAQSFKLQSNGGIETRPKNVALLYCEKQ
ncbi:hypothetical protein [Agarivorans albus]|uniref:Phage tail collar domain-containing protein n=1 Tax=Agarivorans albus MKT 106 TaxID=1331007 RepID=R9PHJ4_AGAAL|nr:hypothetical protein [Agarivorans albus]GAD00802.1 hypothetical protein AALB_0882 [Agarivorans albus MKT 106]